MRLKRLLEPDFHDTSAYLPDTPTPAAYAPHSTQEAFRKGSH